MIFVVVLYYLGTKSFLRKLRSVCKMISLISSSFVTVNPAVQTERAVWSWQATNLPNTFYF